MMVIDDDEIISAIDAPSETEPNGKFVKMKHGGEEFDVYAIWYPEEKCYVTIRKLTPKECFRLQGFGWMMPIDTPDGSTQYVYDDHLFERAALINSDSQLYKQAGNAVSVPVAEYVASWIMEFYPEGYTPTFVDLFAGIGGFHTGLEMAGMKCVGFCEFDKYARMSYEMMYVANDDERRQLSEIVVPKEKDKTGRKQQNAREAFMKKLEERWSKENDGKGRIWYANDVNRVSGTDGGGDGDIRIPKCDILTFGAPCQDFSLSGNRAGLDGERSVLVFQPLRIIKELPEDDKPEWFIYENVKGMLSSNNGNDFLNILREMDSIGYDVQWELFNTKWFIPQNRERVYTIGHLRTRSKAKVLPFGTAGEEDCLVRG